MAKASFKGNSQGEITIMVHTTMQIIAGLQLHKESVIR